MHCFKIKRGKLDKLTKVLQDVAENTPLHEAIDRGQEGIIVLLVDVKDIDFRIANKKGFNALMFATLRGNKMYVHF